ncbi:MAG: branched-chain amino acid aminotransferase [Chitinivibrionales bacterium]|nr:branched-chain amino acid aminotransferase [Chitinivibrionales bacterium]MBD3395615.1 branched-chain amino acid aminotransferase [Chitinivibrionales bacterium]
MPLTIDWKNLGFQYMDTGTYVAAAFCGGKWQALETRSDPLMKLHVAATCLHYGQACFEGLKAFCRKDGTVAMFRPEENAARLSASARRLVMEPVPAELFVEACTQAVRLNRDYVPPYGTGATLYLRPLLIGTTPRVGLKAAEEYLFAVLAMPVGPYYKDGFYPVKAYVQESYDRAAPQGVGNIKAAGNYAAGLLGDMEGKKLGYPICLYLDSGSHRFVDEFGTSNFLGITGDGRYVTPDSHSVLPSITNKSLQQIAKDFGLTVERRQIPITDLELFTEVGACGTAAVITPIYSITRADKVYTFGSEKEAGKTLTRLYNEIQGIQFGDIEDRHGWMVAV